MLLDFLSSQVSGAAGARRFDASGTPPAASATAVLDAKRANAIAANNTQAKKTSAKDTSASMGTVVVTSTKTSEPPLQYPKDMPVYAMQMLFVPYDRTIVFEDAKKQHVQSITLPLPANLSESLGVKYNTVAFGPFVQQLLEAASEATTSFKGDQTGRSNLGDAISKAITKKINAFADNSTDVLGAGFSRLAGGLGEVAETAVNMSIGNTPNPSLAVGFNGVGLRTFTYGWKFAPTSVAESESILNIISAIKRLALPKKNLLTLRYPHFVDLVLHPTSLNDIIKYKTCVITDIKVNWAPSGVPSFFARTQVPTEIELTLSLQETKIFTSDDYAQDVVLKNFNPNGEWWT